MKGDLIIMNLKILLMKKVAVLSITILFAMSMAMGRTVKPEKIQPSETKKEVKTARVPVKGPDGNEINSMARDNFVREFGNIPNVKWAKSSNFDEATFFKNGKEFKAYFDYDGKFVGTTSHVTFADLPADAQGEIKSKYKDYTVDPVVVFFDDNELYETDMELYGIQFKDADNYFVELTRGTKKIVLQVNTKGEVFFFKELS
jgi:hypothetical protein